MRPSESAEELLRFFQQNHLDPDRAALRQVIETVLAFYQAVPGDGLLSSPDVDMLLFQYGTYDWHQGEGENFEIDITRQFIEPERKGEHDVDDDSEDDDYPAISQLHCTVLYEPTDALRALGATNRWCRSKDEIETFRSAIVQSPGYDLGQTHRVRKIVVSWDRV